MKMRQTFTLEISVEIESDGQLSTAELETLGLRVERDINAALDEPPCDWDDWTVGGASVTKVNSEEVEGMGDEDEG